jgi:hypothetical protein
LYCTGRLNESARAIAEVSFADLQHWQIALFAFVAFASRLESIDAKELAEIHGPYLHERESTAADLVRKIQVSGVVRGSLQDR